MRAQLLGPRRSHGTLFKHLEDPHCATGAASEPLAGQRLPFEGATIPRGERERLWRSVWLGVGARSEELRERIQWQ